MMVIYELILILSNLKTHVYYIVFVDISGNDTYE